MKKLIVEFFVKLAFGTLLGVVSAFLITYHPIILITILTILGVFLGGYFTDKYFDNKEN